MGRNNQNTGKAHGKDIAAHLANIAPAALDGKAAENDTSVLFETTRLIENTESAETETNTQEEPAPDLLQSEPDLIFTAETDTFDETTTNTEEYAVVTTSGAENDTLTTNTKDSTLMDGQDGDDYLLGGTGDDTLYGGAGNDYLYGDAGNDTLYGGADADNLVGADGHDTLYGGTGNDSLKGNLGNDALSGGDGNDYLNGGAGDDMLYGGAGDDILLGGVGNDALYGGAGNDILTGYGGADTFHFLASDGAGSVDTITDFNAGMDHIDISDLLSGYDPVTDAISDFVRVTDNGEFSTVSVDSDGGGDNFTDIAVIQNITGINEQLLADSGALIMA